MKADRTDGESTKTDRETACNTDTDTGAVKCWRGMRGAKEGKEELEGSRRGSWVKKKRCQGG